MKKAISIIAAVAMATTMLAACGGGGKTEFKLAFNQTEEHPQYAAGVEFGKRLEQATGKRQRERKRDHGCGRRDRHGCKQG